MTVDVKGRTDYSVQVDLDPEAALPPPEAQVAGKLKTRQLTRDLCLSAVGLRPEDETTGSQSGCDEIFLATTTTVCPHIKGGGSYYTNSSLTADNAICMNPPANGQSEATFKLPGGGGTFSAEYGLYQRCPTGGGEAHAWVQFDTDGDHHGDGVMHRSANIYGGVLNVAIPPSATTITLVVSADGTSACDHVAWRNARVEAPVNP